ncbi:MAG: AMP-binding protein [Bryobacterales bacterium]|nr:AMP-binding protein [Bryobacterales bacterium]
MRTYPTQTVWQIIQESAQRYGDAPALLAPGREPLSYAALGRQSLRLAGRLRDAGIGAEQRVAVVLPNGPEMAAAFAAVASCAACAPLNPSYTRADFEFYLSDLAASAIVVDDATPAAALEAAQQLGVPVLRIGKLARAGEFDLDIAGACPAQADPGPGHTALLLHTSGTTARPKLVPLSSANLAASAAHIAATLNLSPADRCLNIMPLFHIHGLMAALLASLHAGASVICTDGIYANRFFEWMRELRPTWYTAVPTMHQGILARAAEHSQVIGDTPLRFIRSSSASLPPVVLQALEGAFHAPVVEAYGMTEAAHQMACNPLPPAQRKPGLVGPAAGPEIAIMDPAGNVLEQGATGEVVIRGANVTAGYLANPEANRTAFTNGWFRTGDQGRLDADGYLQLTGRLKEIINRGGEKVSPREIDEVLLAHPAVRQALAFAIPHAQLGEELGAAVEVHPGQAVDPRQLRQWVSERLPGFKVPRVVKIVDVIPKGPTGKLQRIGLARVLGIERMDDTVLGEFVAPRTDREERIAALWRQMLPGARAGVEDRFEALGGDSLLAVTMLAAVGAAEGVEIPYLKFVEEGTIAAIAAEIDASQDEKESVIVRLQPEGTRRPLFCVPGHAGGMLALARLAGLLGREQPVLALNLNRLDPVDSVGALAAQCVTHLRRAQANGPYRLVGECFGGPVALEMARLLKEAGAAVEFLAFIDSLNPNWQRNAGLAERAAARWRQMRCKLAYHAATLRRMAPAEAAYHFAGRARAFLSFHGERAAVLVNWSSTPAIYHRRLMLKYRPDPCLVDAVVIRVVGRRLDGPGLGWAGIIAGRMEVVDLPFDPFGAFGQQHAPRVAAALTERLGRL